MRSFEQRIKDNFQQKCFSEINITNRSILYKAIDRRFEMAKYLLCVHINSVRKALCRLRLSSHRLFIERGRWKSIPRVDRKCTLCNEIKDKYHVMLICSRYTAPRKKYLKKYYIVKPSMYKFVALLNAENIKEQQRLTVFTKSLFQEHNKQL